MFGPLIELIDCQSLYNILNEGIEYAKICDPYYLYLLGNYLFSFFYVYESFLNFDLTY